METRKETEQDESLVPVGVPAVVMKKLREEQKSRKVRGVPMSLGALIGEAVMQKYGNTADEGC